MVYIFLIYYGFTFVLGTGGNDAERYAIYLRQTAELPFSDFFKIVGGLYSSETSVDIIQPLITFVVSRFSVSHHLLFAVYAALFGFFYLKSIDLLYEQYHGMPGWNALIIMIFFIMILPITAINGFRMWTATWIFFFGAYHAVLFRDTKYLLVALSSSLVHFSFLSVNAILIVYFFMGNRNLIYLPVVLLSFILPHSLETFFQSISNKLGGAIQSRYLSYTNEAYIQGRQESMEQVAWFMQLRSDLVFYFLLFAIVVIQLGYSRLMKDKTEKNLFSFLLLLLAFVNFGAGIPSFGSRFQLLFFLFATLYVFLFFLKIPGNNISVLTLIGLFPMLLFAVVAFRQGADSINAWLLTPGFGLNLLFPGISLAELLF